ERHQIAERPASALALGRLRLAGERASEQRLRVAGDDPQRGGELPYRFVVLLAGDEVVGARHVAVEVEHALPQPFLLGELGLALFVALFVAGTVVVGRRRQLAVLRLGGGSGP